MDHKLWTTYTCRFSNDAVLNFYITSFFIIFPASVMVSINPEPSHIRIFSKKKLSIQSTIDKIDWNCKTMIASISEFDNVISQIKLVKTCCVSHNKIFLRGSGIDNLAIFQDRDCIARVTQIRNKFNTILLTW